MRLALLTLFATACCCPCLPAPSGADPSAGTPEPAAAAPAPPLEPGSIRVSGSIARLTNDEVTATEALPEALHHAGEALRGVWAAPDGTAYAVGYMYTGVDGPDTGVVYRRSATGEWSIAYTKSRNELGHIWGRAADDLYVAGLTTLAHYDGNTWSEVPIPVREGNLSGVWGNATDLWVCGGLPYGDEDRGRVYHRAGQGPWTVEATAPAYLYGIGGAGADVWAVGNSGTILHRGPDGAWAPEAAPKTQHTAVWASGPHDVYVAGSALLHSAGDGAWSEVALPVEAQVTEVWGRAAGDVYAGTLAGLYHLRDGTWTATGDHRGVQGIAGVGDTVYVAHERLYE